MSAFRVREPSRYRTANALVIFDRTANGDVPNYSAKLATVRIGDVQVYEVDAVVSPAPMPYILLGNSFLTRFQMKRENDVMTLDLRY